MGNPPAHRARKRFGQNFLTDASVIASIVASIAPSAEDHLVEIGPGLGALTGPLLSRVDELHAIELDRDLVARLKKLPRADRLDLHNCDVLQFDFRTLLPAESPSAKLRIVGNLPYNISSPLLFHLLQYRDVIQDMHFMLQKEMALRIAASPGSKNYGRLSVLLQCYFSVELLLEVPPEAFSPAPKVQSGVLRLMPKPSDQTPDVAIDALRKVVQLAFSARRKTLRNNFRTYLRQEQLVSAGFDPTARPETLDLAQFEALTALWLEHNELS